MKNFLWLGFALAVFYFVMIKSADVLLTSVTTDAWLIKPPMTAEEYSHFRIVMDSNTGVYAIQQFEDGAWTQRPNRWTTLQGCTNDMNWWCGHTIRTNPPENWVLLH